MLIREKAEALSLEHAHLKEKAIIHAIQIAEGNFPCFLTAKDFCDQVNCCWRAECLSPHRYDNVHLKKIRSELQEVLAIMARGPQPGNPIKSSQTRASS
jgi:hypothetical protein